MVNHPPCLIWPLLWLVRILLFWPIESKTHGNAGTIICTGSRLSRCWRRFLSFGLVYPFASKVIRSAISSLFKPSKSRPTRAQSYANIVWPRLQLAFAVPDQRNHGGKLIYQPTLIILGNESSGINGSLLRFPGVKASIQLTAAVESLNVAAAGAVLLFEAVRQRWAQGQNIK